MKRQARRFIRRCLTKKSPTTFFCRCQVCLVLTTCDRIDAGDYKSSTLIF